LESRFDWDRFLRLSCHPEAAKQPKDLEILRFAQDDIARNAPHNMFRCRIAVAFDKAFSFYYEDNFDLLREAGAELVFFSPLTDTRLPEGTDLLYFGGGFPELFAAQLAANHAMTQAVRDYHRRGGFIYAECGGLIYLAESGAGLVPGNIRMTDRLQNFGYHEFETVSDTFLFPKGKHLRSHEFHYSVWDGEGKVTPAYLLNGRHEGFAGERILASYQHLHFGGNPGMVEYLIKHLKVPGTFFNERYLVPLGGQNG
jgi:cobyrinic acid a,c-diamide synthase